MNSNYILVQKKIRFFLLLLRTFKHNVWAVTFLNLHGSNNIVLFGFYRATLALIFYHGEI